jgi:hypothetical protein
MKFYFLVVIYLGLSFSLANGQKYFSKTGHIHFISVAPIETIQADNNNGYAVLDVGTGLIECAVLIKGFKFEKALMQQHFNENYLESDKYPKSVFKGTINMANIRLDVNQTYQVNVNGELTIRGITKPLVCPVKLSVQSGVISVATAFDVTIADYGIEVPGVVRGNISKTVKVTVNTDLHPMN